MRNSINQLWASREKKISDLFKSNQTKTGELMFIAHSVTKHFMKGMTSTYVHYVKEHSQIGAI